MDSVVRATSADLFVYTNVPLPYVNISFVNLCVWCLYPFCAVTDEFHFSDFIFACSKSSGTAVYDAESFE